MANQWSIGTYRTTTLVPWRELLIKDIAESDRPWRTVERLIERGEQLGYVAGLEEFRNCGGTAQFWAASQAEIDDPEFDPDELGHPELVDWAGFAEWLAEYRAQ